MEQVRWQLSRSSDARNRNILRDAAIGPHVELSSGIWVALLSYGMKVKIPRAKEFSYLVETELCHGASSLCLD